MVTGKPGDAPDSDPLCASLAPDRKKRGSDWRPPAAGIVPHLHIPAAHFQSGARGGAVTLAATMSPFIDQAGIQPCRRMGEIGSRSRHGSPDGNGQSFSSGLRLVHLLQNVSRPPI